MGIRVNKCIGYGVDNIVWKKKDKYSRELNDPRFDIDKQNNLWDNEDKWNLKAEDFLDWCDSHTKEILAVAGPDLLMRANIDPEEEIKHQFFLLRTFTKEAEADSYCVKKISRRNVYDTYICQDEYGIGEVFHIAPVSSYNWNRYDDNIDWEEETRFQKQLNRYEWLGWNGIYPYNGVMIRCKGELPLSAQNMKNNYYMEKLEKGILNSQEYSMLIGDWDGKNQKPLAEKELLKDLKDNWRCRIPLEIHAQLLLLGFIKDVKSFVNELRPMLYVYWN